MSAAFFLLRLQLPVLTWLSQSELPIPFHTSAFIHDIRHYGAGVNAHLTIINIANCVNGRGVILGGRGDMVEDWLGVLAQKREGLIGSKA